MFASWKNFKGNLAMYLFKCNSRLVYRDWIKGGWGVGEFWPL